MTPEFLGKLSAFRDEALKRGIPAADAERWLHAAARPCATLSPDGDGPVVGRFGGPLMLPLDAPAPYFPFLASIDCASLPAEATDLSLPRDGRLLLFAFALDEYSGGGGSALYVTPGADVEERKGKPDSMDSIDPEVQEETQRIIDQYPLGELHLTISVSLPSYSETEVHDHFWGTLVGEHPYAVELAAVWADTRWSVPSGGPLQLGGYPTDEYGGDGFGPPSEGENDEWVLLADWHPAIEGVEGLTVHWPIRLPDVAERRFDQVDATVFWNP